MDSQIITETSRQTLVGQISFPDAVRNFLQAGVEYYHVDYVGLQTAFYGAAGGVVVVPLTYEGLPPVGREFQATELKTAILDSQRHGQPYREFTRRAMAAGVQGYVAYLSGKRVIYSGRQGDQHIEWFPGAAPGGAQS